jgi:carbon-monoxide dehydrogenase small subunit
VRLTLRVNGETHELETRTDESVLTVLRRDLGLLSVRETCGIGVCGACTVLVDGRPMRSCLLFAVGVDGAEITTVEGCRSADGGLGPVQQAFQDCHGLQCGFCTPGFVTTITAWLREHPDPTEEQARQAIGGNLCRCTGYQNIVNAVQWTARKLQSDSAATGAS